MPIRLAGITISRMRQSSLGGLHRGLLVVGHPVGESGSETVSHHRTSLDVIQPEIPQHGRYLARTQGPWRPTAVPEAEDQNSRRIQ